MDNPTYYAIIPAIVRYDNRLKANEKLLYGEITTLTNKTGVCWAQNSYFSKLYGKSKETISRWISNLEKYNHIKTTVKRDEKKQVIKREIRINQEGSDKNVNRGNDVFVKHPIDENIKDNNTSNNNTSNNTYRSPSLEEIKKYISEKNLNVEPDFFFEYFEAGKWKDSKGNKVKSWRQKLLTWHRHAEKTKPSNTEPQPAPSSPDYRYQLKILEMEYTKWCTFFAGKYGAEWSSDNLEPDEIKEMLDYQGKIAKLKKKVTDE